MRRARFWAAAGFAAAAVGCGGGNVAPVSGTVHLDGKPLAGAAVTFSPDTGKDGGVGGSYGKTDGEGRYTLRSVIGDQSGAAVGKHKVSISLVTTNPENPEAAQQDLVPAKYNAKTELTFDVPAGGTSQADFKLTK
jgi:hypothetical protein